jgi:hypothetical protein
VVADLVGARRRNEGDQPLQQLGALHQDVRRAVAPARLEVQGEPSVGTRFEAIVREGRTRDVATQSLEPVAVSRRDGEFRVEAHPGVLRHAGRGFGVDIPILGLDAIAQAPPALTNVGARRDAPAQRRGGERSQQGLISGEGVVVSIGALLEQSRDAARRAGQHALREAYRLVLDSLERARSLAGSGRERTFTPRALRTVYARTLGDQSRSRGNDFTT